MRWTLSGGAGSSIQPPLAFTVWVNPGQSEGYYAVAVEYEFHGGGGGGAGAGDEGGSLRDVSVSIPFAAAAEPTVTSFDATYEVGGDRIEWKIGGVDEGSASGSFEFEAQAESDEAFFPMAVRFAMTKAFVDVDVSILLLLLHLSVFHFSPVTSSRKVKLLQFFLCCSIMLFKRLTLTPAHSRSRRLR